MSQNQRPDFFELQNGSKAKLPFSNTEYENRLAGLRQLMVSSGVDAMLLTSMHNMSRKENRPKTHQHTLEPSESVDSVPSCVGESNPCVGGRRRRYGGQASPPDAHCRFWATSIGSVGDYTPKASR